MKFDKTKDKLSDLICEILYEAKKIYPYPSLNKYLYYEYYQAVEAEKQKKEQMRKEKQRIRSAIDYLKKVNYISVNEKQQVKLTEKGFIKAILSISSKHKAKKQKNCFYLVIFDVPEKYRRVRDLLRKVLYNFGADRVQKSVFILRDKSAYEHVKYLIKISKISSYVKLFSCDREV